MGGMDLILISISSYLDNRNDAANDEKNYNPKLAWKEKERTLNVDLKGFIALAEVAFDFFKAQNHGHFVGISSSSGLNGFASTPVYSGSKACLSTYMQGMRNLFARDGFDIQVTDVIPGYVEVEHSPLGEDPNAFWEIPCEQAGKDILAGIKSRSNTVYVPARTRLLALLKFMPEFIYHKFFNWL
jgi:short-subunit dehydrogenase